MQWMKEVSLLKISHPVNSSLLTFFLVILIRLAVQTCIPWNTKKNLSRKENLFIRTTAVQTSCILHEFIISFRWIHFHSKLSSVWDFGCGKLGSQASFTFIAITVNTHPTHDSSRTPYYHSLCRGNSRHPFRLCYLFQYNQGPSLQNAVLLTSCLGGRILQSRIKALIISSLSNCICYRMRFLRTPAGRHKSARTRFPTHNILKNRDIATTKRLLQYSSGKKEK